MTSPPLAQSAVGAAPTYPCRHALLLAAFAVATVLGACSDDTTADHDTADTGFTEDTQTDAATSDTGTSDVATSDTGEVDTADDDTCVGETSHRYDPLNSTELELWPDHFLTRDDPESPTGLRVDLTGTPWLATAPDLLRGAFEDMEVVSGFGTNGGAVIRFDGPIDATALPQSADDSRTSRTVLWLDLDATPPRRIAYEAKIEDDGKDLILWPLETLATNRRHAVIVTTELRDAAGDCIGRAGATNRILVGTANGGLARNEPLWREAIAAAEIGEEEVIVVTAFTTHADLDIFVDIASEVAAASPDWLEPPACERDGPRIRCDGLLSTSDYRNELGFIDGQTEPAPWGLPVSATFPASGDGPYPTIILGHGLNSDRHGNAGLMFRLADKGWAVVSADAVHHGAHPSVEPDAGNLRALDFLGIDLGELALDALALRGNFNQTAVDRLHLVEMLIQHGDLDGDGVREVDAERLGYWGISLGGMLGPSLLALTDQLDSAILSVAGGRLLTFATGTAAVEAFLPVVIDLVGSEALFRRLLPVAQTLVDAADPATWARFVLTERLVGTQGPHLLLPVANEDVTVPPASGRALARGLAIPHVRPVVTPVGVIAEVDAPLTGNLDGVTAGYFQMDRVGAENPSPATHANAPLGPEGSLQAFHFLDTWLADGTPTIIDPYAELGTPPLP